MQRLNGVTIKSIINPEHFFRYRFLIYASIVIFSLCPRAALAWDELVNPDNIYFSQNNVNEDFYRFVVDWKPDLNKQNPINVIQYGDRWISMDNRRLLAARYLRQPIWVRFHQPGDLAYRGYYRNRSDRLTWEDALRKRLGARHPTLETPQVRIRLNGFTKPNDIGLDLSTYKSPCARSNWKLPRSGLRTATNLAKGAGSGIAVNLLLRTARSGFRNERHEAMTLLGYLKAMDRGERVILSTEELVSWVPGWGTLTLNPNWKQLYTSPHIFIPGNEYRGLREYLEDRLRDLGYDPSGDLGEMQDQLMYPGCMETVTDFMIYMSEHPIGIR